MNTAMVGNRSWVETVWQDVRFGARSLRKHPGFTLVAVITLALGISANTAIFSIIESVLLRPLPYRDPERLVTVCQSSLKRGFSQVIVTPGVFRDWQEQNSVFKELGGQIYESVNLTGIERPQHLHAAWTTPNYFSVFGVAPLLGRTFQAEDRPPGHRVVVLSYPLWQGGFGGDRQVVGRGITLNGMSYTVVGVMPAQFRIYQPPAVFGLPTGEVQPQLWAPYPGSMDERTNHYFLAFGRLKPSINITQAQGELNAIAERAAKDWPSQRGWGANVQPLNDQIVGGARPALHVLLGAVGFVLLIACANVANLCLARSSARQREFALRSALGAGRWQLVRQLLVESILLALVGGMLGFALARWGLAVLTALQPASLPRFDEIRMDRGVLAFTSLISLLTGVLFGLVPALQASKPNLETALKEGSQSTGIGPGGWIARNSLVVAEVALAMVLLAGAGVMIHSFMHLMSVRPGFAPEQLVSCDFSVAGRAFDQDEKRIALVKQLRERIQTKLGSSDVATVYGLPFGTMLNAVVGTRIEQPDVDAPEIVRAAWRVVSPNYFKTMGIGLLQGRTFSEQLDTPASTPAAIVNQAFVAKFFHGQNPVGKRIQLVTLSTNWHQIVGVIQDVKLTGLEKASVPEVYQTDSQNGEWMFSLVIRSTFSRRLIEQTIRAEAAAVDRDLPPFNLRTMEQAIGTSVAARRFAALLLGLFAGLAVALAAVGIYGVVAYSVSARTREIGIRIALGASRANVLGLMFRQGMRFVSIGVVLGLLGSLALSPLITAQLFEVSATDPATLGMVAVLLLTAAMAACYLPARRGAKLEPMSALRCE